MPELPEVETIKRELAGAVLNKKITEVIVNCPRVIKQPSRAGFINGIKDLVIKNILRKGKLLICELSSGKSLCVHLRMTGQLIYPGNGQRSRVSFRLSNAKMIDFNDQRLLGELRLVDNWRNLKFIKELGPEPSEITAAQFKQMLGRRRTKIKPLLLDQKFISGVGNLYACEALFRSGIHPLREAGSLGDKEKTRLLREINRTLKEAIKYGGSSVDQYVRLSGKGGGYAHFHKVYGRNGKPCLICKKPITRISLAGRGTYLCGCCQK